MKLTLKNILHIISFFAGIVAFIGAFSIALQTKISAGNTSININLTFDHVYFGTDTINGTPVPFIGFVFMLLGSFLTILALFSKESKDRFNAIALLAFIAGLIMIALIRLLYINANNLNYETKTFTLGTGPILGIIAGTIAALSSAIAGLIKE